MSAIPSFSATVLEAQLAALNAQLFPAPVRVPRLVDGPPAPEEPTVTVSLRVALEAVTALRSEAATLRAAATVTRRGSTDDLAAAWYRYEGAQAALDALAPLVEVARQENRRRWAEHQAEWSRMRREAARQEGEVA